MKSNVLGIDIGGTNIKWGLTDADGTILSRRTDPTDSFPDVADFIDNLTGLIQKLKNEHKTQISAIGIGAPNANQRTGYIENAPNLPWKGKIPFAKILEQKLGLPCKITNDANAAALGEMRYGNAKQCKNFLLITLGTGVGSGCVVDGKLILGHTGYAGELGHTIVFKDGIPHWSTGIAGTLEAYASATGLVRNYKNLFQNAVDQKLLANDLYECIEAKDITRLAKNGEPEALQVFDLMGEALGIACANYSMLTSPQKIIFAGGLSGAFSIFLPKLTETFDQYIFPTFRNSVSFELTSLEASQAAILGAAALAWDDF